MLLLSRSDAKRVLSMPEAIDAVKGAFAQLSTGRADIPLRAAVPQKTHDGLTLFMPGYLSDSDALAIKVVTIHNRNPARNLPLIHAIVLVIDAATGQPVAAIEGGYLTALRTGAASGVATDLLAVKEAKVAAIFGAGAQARMQLSAIVAVRPIERCWIYARHREGINTFISEMQPKVNAELLGAASPAYAVREADIICAATTSAKPVFDGHDVKPGCHINAIGSYTSEMQEIDCETLHRAAKIVVDERKAALAEAGDVIIAVRRGVIRESDIYAELGEIAAGLKPGRENELEVTYFKSVGNAAQDAAVAHVMYQQAIKQGIGAKVDLIGAQDG